MTAVGEIDDLIADDVVESLNGNVYSLPSKGLQDLKRDVPIDFIERNLKNR